jgi:TPR repeat protein
VSAFKIAAYHADKHSQHYLSLIFWHGAGVPADRLQAYIWSDLAGERGIKPLLVIREKMWSQLTLAEQAQVQGRRRGVLRKIWRRCCPAADRSEYSTL